MACGFVQNFRSQTTQTRRGPLHTTVPKRLCSLVGRLRFRSSYLAWFIPCWGGTASPAVTILNGLSYGTAFSSHKNHWCQIKCNFNWYTMRLRRLCRGKRYQRSCELIWFQPWILFSSLDQKLFKLQHACDLQLLLVIFSNLEKKLLKLWFQLA